MKRYASKGRVTVSVLRQKLMLYLRRVANGKTFQVTERGRPIAVLAPLPARQSALERLVAAGRATAPSGDVRALGVPRGRVSRRLSAALRDDR
jgi:prevent-host-death family protein